MKRSFLWLSLVALAACTPKDVQFAVNIVTQNCDPAFAPFEGAQYLRLKVTGDGMEPLSSTTPTNLATPELKIPDIPSGTNRVVEVRVYDGDPAGGANVISVGRSLPFTVPDVVEQAAGESIRVNVVLRKVDVFSPIVSAGNPASCQTLRQGRAGHTATLLADGRVFIAGGYTLRAGPDGGVQRQALADTEIFNPGTGAFEPAKPISLSAQGTAYSIPRAFHTATLLKSGSVLLWGGESYETGIADSKASFIVYDVTVDDYASLGPRSPPAIPRARHRAAADKNGNVLIVGGVKTGGSPVTEVEWFDGSLFYKIVDGLNFPRLDAVLQPVKQGEFLVVAGGTNGAQVSTDISFFKFAGGTFAQQTLSVPPRLGDPGRRSAAGAVIRDGADLLLIGGYTSATAVAPTPTSEVLNGTSAQVTPGPGFSSSQTDPGRGDMCAVTLDDGSVLAIGGRTLNGTATVSDSTSWLVSVQGSVLSRTPWTKLPKARYFHTCTKLADGSVLVAGGINETESGAPEVLQDAYVYTPKPTD